MDEFAAFYLRCKDDVLRAVVGITGDVYAAEDAVAEAFVRACARWNRLSSHPNPQAWVALTALNVQRSRWRRLWRERPHPPERPAPAAEPGLDDRLTGLILALPQRQREVLVLRVILQLDTAETATALGMAPGTVTAHLHRATATLRRALEPTEA